MKVGDWVEHRHSALGIYFRTYGWVSKVSESAIFMRKVASVYDLTGKFYRTYSEKDKDVRFYLNEVRLMDNTVHPDDRAEIINLSLDSKDPGWFKELLEG